MRLKPKVTRINAVSTWLNSFVIQMVVTLQVTSISYLLEDRYNVTDDEAAAVVGNLGTVGDVASVASEVALGYAMDFFGRKIPIVAGVFVAGIATFSDPLPRRLAGLYPLRGLCSIGYIPSLWSPYGVDYVRNESQGLWAGIGCIGTQTATVLATSGSIQLRKVISISWAYYITGSLTILVACWLCYGLNDVHEEPKKSFVEPGPVHEETR